MSNTQKTSLQKTTGECGSEVIKLKELFESSIRLEIFNLLNIYPELSFSEIAKKLNKSKSTIHPHLQKLLDLNLVLVSREEKIRGNIPAKYYTINSETFGNLLVSGCDPNDYKSQINEKKNWINYLKSNMELFLKLLNKIEDDPKAPEILKRLGPSKSLTTYFTRESYEKFIKFYDEVVGKKVLELEKEQFQKQNNAEKPYFMFSLGIPIGTVLKELKK